MYVWCQFKGKKKLCDKNKYWTFKSKFPGWLKASQQSQSEPTKTQNNFFHLKQSTSPVLFFYNFLALAKLTFYRTYTSSHRSLSLSLWRTIWYNLLLSSRSIFDVCNTIDYYDSSWWVKSHSVSVIPKRNVKCSNLLII